MKSAGSTPSSAQKHRRNHLDEFLPLYKKFGESNAELNKQHKSSENHVTVSSKIDSESPKHQLSSSKSKEKQAVNITHIIIDGTSLNSGAGGSTPHNESKVTSTPLASTKKSAKFDKNHKKNSSTLEDSATLDDGTLSHSTSKSQKRSKSVSFLLEEKDKAVVKKPKSDDLQEGTKTDTPIKVKKHKKNKKSEKENKGGGDQLNVNEPGNTKKDKFKNHQAKSGTKEIPVPLAIDNETDQGDSVVINKKIKKHSKKKNKEKLDTGLNQIIEKTKKAKKQKHHDKNDVNDGEPASKSPRTEFIADNLESLNLGDNTHTLTNLIDEMAVVDKAKQKKLRKTTNREKKQHQIINQDETEKKQNQKKTDDINHNETGDTKNEVQTEKKKWKAKRWNKQQIAEKDQNTTINVDNLPVSLLKGNFKKVLIDHFSKYGNSRSVGEPFIQNEEDTNPVFTTKVYFSTAESATEALEMDGTSIAGNKIRVSPMRPMTETVLVIRIYGHPDKLNSKDVKAAFHEVGLIRSIRPMLRKKKTMATAFIEFDGPDAVERALQKCTGLMINGKQVMASLFKVRTSEKKKKRKRGSKKKSAKNTAVPNESGKGTPEESGSDDSDD